MTLRIGHRGAAGTAPENTLASFRRALSIGVDAVEFDIHRTRDGVLVVMHDFTVERCSNGKGTIGEMTLEELRRLDTGSWYGPEFAGETVPTLAELVEAVPAPVVLFLEIKAGSYKYPGLEEQLAAFIQEHNLLGRIQISSFDHFALKRMRELLPELETAVLYAHRSVDPVGLARSCNARAIHPNWSTITRETVAEAHAAGLKVNVWTPNSQEAINACYDLGVDGIITDFPERLRVNA